MNLLSKKGAHTQYTEYRRRFPRVIVIASDIDEFWSVDVVYVDKLARHNGVKTLLVSVNILSQRLKVLRMGNTTAEETANTFGSMIVKIKPQNVWSGKCTEFMGALRICQDINIHA